MSPTTSYNSELLAALINARAGSLPITHGHALDIIASLNGANNWNALAAHPAADRFKAEAKRLRVYLQRPDVSLPLDAAAASLILGAFVDSQTDTKSVTPGMMHSMQALLPSFVAKAKFDERFYLGHLESHPEHPGKPHPAHTHQDREWLNELASLQGKVSAYMRKVAKHLDTDGGPFEFYGGPVRTPRDQASDDLTSAHVDIFCRSADGILRQIAFIRLQSPDDENGWDWCPSFSNKPAKLPAKSGLLGKSEHFLDVLKFIEERLMYKVESYALTGIRGDASALDGPLNTVQRIVRG